MHLKTAAFDLVIKARDADINAQRTFLGDVSGIDHQVSKAVFNQLGFKENTVFAHVAAGWFWGEDQLAPINETEGLCPHCGKQGVDTTHITGECPCINKYRTINKLKDLDVRQLLKAIADGMPLGTPPKAGYLIPTLLAQAGCGKYGYAEGGYYLKVR